MNDELIVINDGQTKRLGVLFGMTSSISAHKEELNEKDEQKHAWTSEFAKAYKIFRETIAEILFMKNLALTKTKILDVKWRHRFTNMAQGFMTSDGMLLLGGRESAQGAAHIITDDKDPFQVPDGREGAGAQGHYFQHSPLDLCQSQRNHTQNPCGKTSRWGTKNSGSHTFSCPWSGPIQR